MTRQSCQCESSPLSFQDFVETRIGVDERKGRYGDVTIKECKRCQRKWLCYSVEYEAFTRSGRWYRGVISEIQAQRVLPENACEMLEQLDWYIYGGSYFGTTGRRGAGPLYVDH